ncbi:hypothetical protein EYF80_042195 [Liparis tanakae]|uniref:Uncharacterized protein n=1 Tax=Liparis tanakae TaxID=230148 RepID=A0A4Z2G4U4_9TELE|nr:hypothetical protein EYF80_042195 [Liparis tanakae]
MSSVQWDQYFCTSWTWSSRARRWEALSWMPVQNPSSSSSLRVTAALTWGCRRPRARPSSRLLGLDGVQVLVLVRVLRVQHRLLLGHPAFQFVHVVMKLMHLPRRLQVLEKKDRHENAAQGLVPPPGLTVLLQASNQLLHREEKEEKDEHQEEDHEEEHEEEEYEEEEEEDEHEDKEEEESLDSASVFLEFFGLPLEHVEAAAVFQGGAAGGGEQEEILEAFRDTWERLADQVAEADTQREMHLLGPYSLSTLLLWFSSSTSTASSLLSRASVTSSLRPQS